MTHTVYVPDAACAPLTKACRRRMGQARSHGRDQGPERVHCVAAEGAEFPSVGSGRRARHWRGNPKHLAIPRAQVESWCRRHRIWPECGVDRDHHHLGGRRGREQSRIDREHDRRPLRQFAAMSCFGSLSRFLPATRSRGPRRGQPLSQEGRAGPGLEVPQQSGVRARSMRARDLARQTAARRRCCCSTASPRAREIAEFAHAISPRRTQ